MNMDTTKKHFIERANELGVLLVRERNSKEDLTGWGAIEFILSNGEIDEDGLWVDMNKLNAVTLGKIKHKASRVRREQKEDTISAWLKHQKV
jgi:hypothetical protein